MNHDHWTELAEIYAAGALDGAELKGFEKHLKSRCASCLSTIRETEEALSLLSGGLKIEPPPSFIKESLLGRISAEASPQAAAGARWWLPAGMGLAVAFSVILLFSPVFHRTTLAIPAAYSNPGPNHDMKMTQLLNSPDLKRVLFKDTATGKVSAAQLQWNPKLCGGCFSVKGLPPSAEGKTYELWALSGDKAFPAATFKVDADGQGHFDVLPMKQAGSYERFAVSVEPAGGTSSPSGPILLQSF